MTLRDLLTHTEKMTRDVIETVHGQYMPKVTEFRELSRPARKKSQYPTLLGLDHAAQRVEVAVTDLRGLMKSVEENVAAIAERIRKERLERM